MKPVQRTGSASQSCSCTSCLYKSESEQPSIRKYIAHGSRIDRLYYGKYIPLRERKLLNRLVRTRAVYDDLRARLISDSTLSLDKNADLRPRKHHHAMKTLSGTEKSGAILEIVDIIDKGAATGPKKLSECCSCCSCTLKAKILERDRKENKYKRSHNRRFETKYGHRAQYGHREQYGHRAQYGQRMGERYNKRGVRFKAKHIRSDPCTCTFKFSGLIKKHSKAMMRKIHPPPPMPIMTLEDREMMNDTKFHKLAGLSSQKYKELQEKLKQDMRKLNESVATMKENVQIRTKKSIEQMKQAKDKLKTNIESGVRKSVEAVKGLQRKNKAFEYFEYPEEEETNFKIKKDSIVKFKDYLKRKEIMKDWACDLECVPDTCEPEECFRILKLRRPHRRNERDRKQAVKYETFHREVDVGEEPLRKSSSSVQVENFATTAATHMKKQKPILRVEDGNEIMGQRVIFETKEVRKEIKQGVKKGGKDKVNLQQIVVEKSEESPPIATGRKGGVAKNIRDTRRKGGVKEKEHFLKKGRPDSGSRKAARIGSSLGLDMEFGKSKPDSKTSSRSSQPSGIHLTGNRARGHKKARGHHKGSQVVLKPSIEAPQRGLKKIKIHRKRHDAQNIQQNEYDVIPKAEMVVHSNTKTNTPYGTKSVSSLTKKPVDAADKKLAIGVTKKEPIAQVAHENSAINESPSSHKQAVRIESKFSFSVEFYKKDNRDDVNDQKDNQVEVPFVKERVKHTRNMRTYVAPQKIKNKGSLARAKYIQAKTTLARCICTLKLRKFKKPKKRINTSTTGTVTSIITKTSIPPAMIDKHVETKKRNRLELPKTYQLLPYECEPGICVPGECDPIICKQLLDQRNKQLKTYDRGSYTSSRQTKSASSVASKPFAVKTKNVQSSVIPTKLGKTYAPRRFKEEIVLDQTKETKPGRQAVRIGSSFSFNIEFYKDKQSPTIDNEEDVVNVSRPAEVKYKKPKLKEGGYQDYNKNNKSMFAQVIHLDQNIGPSLKRCFCTLKLYKNKNIKKKRIKQGRMLTAVTQTFDEMEPVTETVDRGTKTKWRHNYELLPYECEPYFCIPGECDPYVCLERIKRRQVNVRDYGVFTGKPKMSSMSSFTENSYTRSTAILAQPKLYRKGTNIKEKHYKTTDDRPREAIALRGGSGEAYDSINSKQAVRIGSSFNFSIEFSKQLPQALILTKQPKREKIYKEKQKRYRDKGNKVANVYIDHVDVDTQSIEPRKVHRSSLVRPMLKRCFCTLNLQKKTKQYRKGRTGWAPGNQYFAPKMYTVSRAMTTKTGIYSHHNFGSQDAKLQVIASNKKISISTSSFLFKKYVTTSISKYNTLKLCPVLEMPVRLRQPIKMNSNLSVEIEFIREFKVNKESMFVNNDNIKQPLKSFSFGYIKEKPLERINVFSQPSLQTRNPQEITGISQYLERCFYTMNVQISQAKVPAGKKHFNYKLKPYECEPGICVPGECNPYECQKLIMKRLMRTMHRGSGTQSDNKSISSYTTQTGSGSRSTQFRRHGRSRSQESKPERYKTTTNKYQREAKHRQAVRVGSSFSFDVEFSKNASQPPERGYRENERIRYRREPARSTYSSRSKGAQGRRVRYGKDSQMQSTSSLVHRGSNYAPRMKRCFCTLKLQKKGRIHRANAKLDVIPAAQPPSIESRSIKIGTANAKYQNIPKQHRYKLEPYECEPGVCIPGQCNPYECLERIKNRKDFGVSTASHGERSISSMTSDGAYARKKLQTHGINVTHKGTHKKDRRRGKGAHSISPIVSERRSRQAVRIGSNFSFNIEFYKGAPGGAGAPHMKEIDNGDKSTRSYKSEFRERRPRKHLKGSLSQSSRAISHRDTQMETPTNQMSTMTSSFMKRCFCTAKLQGIKIPQEQNTSTFMQRCFCLLGLRNKQKTDKQHEKNISKTADKRTNTHNRHKVQLPALEPYECEPGICIPGQCDPYACDKIIQQRLAKQYSKSSGTESVRTQSVSSNFGYGKRHRDGTTQARARKYNKQKQYASEDRSYARKYTNNENKRLVRIGSNFSFNVEFYKENVDGSKTKEEAREIKTSPSRIDSYKAKQKIKHMKSTGTVGPSVGSNESQVAKKEMRAFGVNPLLKRCFCTLKLLKRPTDQAQNINKVDTKTVLMKTAETQSHKMLDGPPLRHDFRGDGLLPYECEPNVCIPGECNPIECLERIKRRNQNTKDFGTVTEYPQRKSIGSVATRTTKDEYLQAKYRGTKPNKTTQKTHYVEKIRQPKSGDHSRQAVRIGSNFSFNIEFYKGTQNDGGDVVHATPSQEYIRMKKDHKRTKRHHTKSQPSYFGRSVDTQASTKMQSTDTGMSHLKRCFCTLQLKNKSENKLNKPKSEHSAVGEFLKRCMCVLKINKVGKLQQQAPTPAVKYEIKGTSTYSQCPKADIRPVRMLEPYECEPNFCIPGECDPYECLKRIQKRPVRHFGTEYTRNVRDSATDSIKGPYTRDTESQFHRKQRLYSQGTSFPSKRRRRSDDMSQYSSQYRKKDNSNKQAVRIGSNFSFNIEFFKEKGDQRHSEYRESKVEKIPKIKTRSERIRARSRGSESIGRNIRCQSSQCPFLKKHVMSSAANTMPKRCFCTLKLLKNPNNLKSDFKPMPPIPPPITTDDKMIGTKNKYTIPHELGVYECPPLMCIPGECDPYDCLEKLKKRGRKFRNMGTRPGKTSIASVGNRSSKIKAHGNQSVVTKRNLAAYTPRSEPQSVILKSPQMAHTGRQNKRAVRIGSNFNFSIDFFKEKSQPAVFRSPKIVRTRDTDEDLKSYLNKNVTANAGKFRHHDSQVGSTITRDQGSDAGNLLKRCFCTLQLQKSSRQRKKLQHPGINVQYPQTVTVGRVSVEPFNKKLLKTQRVCTQNQASQIRRSKSTDPKIMNNLRTVSTKIDKKHLQNKKFLQSDCYPSSCPNYQKRSSLKKRTKNDMQTILPYTPSKFNKKESKTLVSNKDKLQKIHNLNQLTFENDNKPRDTLTFNKGKRLTAKKSKKSIPPNKLDTKSYLNNSILCRCARIFSKRTGTEIQAQDRVNTDKLCSEQLKIVVTPKKAKSVKLPKTTADETCPVICPKIKEGSKKKYSIFQSGDAQSNIKKRESTKNVMLNDLEPKSEERKSISKNQKMKVTFANSTKYPPSMTSETRKKFPHRGSLSKLCYSCSVNNCPLLSEKIQTDKEKSSVFHKFTNRLSKTYDKPIAYSESADNCQYCQLCKKKLEADEINKGAGDREIIEKAEKKSLSKKKKLSGSGDKRLSVASQHKGRPCPCGKHKPLLEMRVDAVNYDIINKQEILQRVNNDVQDDDEPLSKKKDKHGDSCNCCKCTKKRLTEGAKISVPAKGTSKIPGAPGKTLVKKGPAKMGPCICGSIKCAIESKRTKSKSGAHEYKPCVCGSDICAKESKKMKKLRARYVCTCKEEMDRRRAEREIYNKKDLQRRLLIEREKDEKRRLKRLKRNAELERRVKKYKGASDTMLAVDSLIDVGKLGVSTLGDVVRTTAKAIYDPKVALERMKCKKTTPEFALQQFEKRYMESDAAATARRLKLRCMFMRNVQEAKQKLEENPITHFILHIADRNPKTRKFKRKPARRVREPLDFECSLYMASLRKRPCLSVYYKWPWFYPHLVTMLNIWKQFTDVTLFLLAAVVWSPCILCMEGCRAIMCCFFCTG